jgi:hypothetical protein
MHGYKLVILFDNINMINEVIEDSSVQHTFFRKGIWYI